MSSFVLTNTSQSNLDLGGGIAIRPGSSVVVARITEPIERNLRAGGMLAQEINAGAVHDAVAAAAGGGSSKICNAQHS